MLAPLEVHASIAPVAGPNVGSGVPARVSTIGRDELSAWQPKLLTDAVIAQPDLNVYDDLGSPKKVSLGMRGFSVGPTVGSPAGISVFLDGVRQNEPDAQEVNFDLLPMDAVKRIEVLSGTASLLGPNGLGGAINLVTDRGGGPAQATAEVEGGSFGDAAGTLSFTGRSPGDWSYYALAGGDRADGWRAATNTRASRVFINASRTGDERGVNVQLYAGRSRAATAGSLPESIFDRSPRGNFTAGDVDDIDLLQGAVSGFAAVAGGTASFTTYVRDSHANRFNANQAPDPNVRNVSTNTSEGASADWRRAVTLGGATLDVRGGVDAADDQIVVRLFDIAQGSPPRADSLSTDVSSPRISLATYALGDVVAGRATFSAGARYDYIRSPFDDHLNPGGNGTSVYRSVTPRGGVSVDLGSGARVYVSVGTSFRAPALLELGCADPAASCPLPFALGDDPPLEPVRATSYETGGQWLMGDVLVRGSLYRTDVRDEIFFVASPGSIVSGYFTNLDRTRRTGGEIDVQGTLRDRFTWSASYSRSSAIFENAVRLFSARSEPDFAGSPLAGPNQVQAGDQLPLIPQWQVKGEASVDIGHGLSAGLSARRVGPQWLRGDEANETHPLAAYDVFDARSGVSRGPWDLSLVVQNALDSHAAFFGTFNENLQTGTLERFLTPLGARTVRITIRRSLGG